MTQSLEKTQLKGKVLADPRFIIPQAGIEAIPVASLVSTDFNGSGAEAGFFEMTAENSIGSVLVVVAYQAVLTALKSESARREGTITRAQQIKLIASTALETGRSSAFTLIVAAALISVFPWLTPVFTLLGIVGGGAMAVRIGNEFWSALSEEQKVELRKAADNAKVNIDKMIPQDKSVEVSAMPA
jgi:hypothetical protein